MHIKSTFLLSFLLLLALSAASQTPSAATLTTNTIKATFNSNGALFTDLQNGQFIAPYTPGQQELGLLRAAGLWMAGIDPLGNLRGAAQLYNTNGNTDYHPGIINQTDPSAGPLLTGMYRVTRAEIEAHVADIADNGVIDNPQPGVFGWPGQGNPYFTNYHPDQQLPFTGQFLGPFFDANGDANYDPSQGDYPSIEVRGCPLNRVPTEMLWFAFNADGIHTETGLLPVKIDIQCQVFAYDCTEESVLRNTIFVRYKIINYSEEPLEDFYTGVFTDFSIGNPSDDYFGSDAGRSMIFGYNSDAVDEGGYETEAPAMAVKLFRGPLDVQGEQIDLKHVVSFNPSDVAQQPLAFYNILQGKFPDGTPAPNDGFQYPGNPNEPGADTEIAASNTPGRRRVVGSYGPFTLLPGAVNELIAGFFYSQEPGQTPLQNVQDLYAQADELQAFFDACFQTTGCSSIVAASEPVSINDLQIFPNPTRGNLTVASRKADIVSVRLFDLTGREVYSTFSDNPQAQLTIPVSTLAPGLYWAKVGTVRQQEQVEKIVVIR